MGSALDIGHCKHRFESRVSLRAVGPYGPEASLWFLVKRQTDQIDQIDQIDETDLSSEALGVGGRDRPER